MLQYFLTYEYPRWPKQTRCCTRQLRFAPTSRSRICPFPAVGRKAASAGLSASLWQVRADPGNIVWQQNLSEILTDVASILLATGQPREARVQAQRGLQLAKAVADRPGATGDQIYNYAWLAVTVDPEDLRDPAAALPYAAKSVELSKGEDPMCLHILAQAYAGTHDYRRAVETEEKALALFAPVEPGKPAPRNRGIVERALERYRKEVARPGGEQVH